MLLHNTYNEEVADLTPLQQAGILVGVASGATGTILSLLNFIRISRASKARVRVSPVVQTLIARYDADPSMNHIEGTGAFVNVVNTGRVTIKIDLVAMTSSRWWSKQGYICVTPKAFSGSPWPLVIEPGDQEVIPFKITKLLENGDFPSKVGRVYVRSTVDHRHKCSWRTMRKFKKLAVREQQAIADYELDL